jgi:hypothetical protein
MKKTILFAFRGDPMCFVHVLLNSLDMASRGMGGRIVIEGEAVKILPQIAAPDHFLHQLYSRARDKNLFVGACRACSTKLGVANELEQIGVELIGDMSGHPSMAPYIEQDYTVLTF